MVFLKHSVLTGCVFLFAVNLLTAQQATATVQPVSPVKIHIHTDKDGYLPGATIWFKSYLVIGYLPDTLHTNLFVDLVNQNGKVFNHQVMPVTDASSAGSFQLPDSVSAQAFFIRAYTNHTADTANGDSYYKRIDIITKKAIAKPVDEIVKTNLYFFPEGGVFVGEVVNRLSFKSAYSNGLPYELKGIIRSEEGIVIDSIRSVHNGMGVFSITPKTNEQYIAEWTDEKGALRQTRLPLAVAQGITLHTEQVNNYLYYVVQCPEAVTDLSNIHVKAYLHDKEIYQATLATGNTPVISGRLALNALPSGIVRITAFDNNDHPLAERICFVDNQFRLDTKLAITEKNTAKRGRNTIEIEVPDTLLTNLSVSVYEAGFHQDMSASIYTDLLLGNEIKGYVYEPAWYFAEATDERKKALDLVMQTNGWRKYIAQPITDSVDDNYITLKGIVTDQKKMPVIGEPVTVMIQQKDSTKLFYTLRTDASGKFSKNGLFFFDSVQVWYQFNRKNKRAADFRINIATNITTHPVYSEVPVPSLRSLPLSLVLSKEAVIPERFFVQNTADGFTNKGFRLNEVTVSNRKWKNDPMLLMDEKYTTGIYRGNARAFSFDVLNDPMATAKGDILNYLIGKVPGLSLDYPKKGALGGFKKLLMRNNPVELIFIDEHRFEFNPAEALGYSEIQNLNMNDIAYVKFYDTYPLEPLKSALAIYLKKGDEITQKDLESGLPKTKVAGYTTVKEFYSPDYSVPETKQAAVDLRTTLYWQPYISTDKNNSKATIHFYNNDASSKMWLVVEGMNEAGKLIRIEKMIE
ncbi:MAG: hypothetical protein V4450_01985 [Bacteroidota bacterium]